MTRRQLAGCAIAGAIALAWGVGHERNSALANVETAPAASESPAPAAGAVTSIADGGATKGGETYPAYQERRDALNGSAGAYAGEGCTQDCSGHQAGYDWAEAHDIDDPDDCGGNSWSFEEGCRAYASEQQGDDDTSDGGEGKDEGE